MYMLLISCICVLYARVDDVQVSEDSEKHSGLMLKTLCEQFDLSHEEVKSIRWKGNIKNVIL